MTMQHPYQRKTMDQRSITRKRTLHTVALSVLLLACADASAQTSSDNCSYAAANQYTVNTTCVFQTLNKPAAYVANYNPATCGAGAFDDAFGWFQATSTTTVVTFDPLLGLDPILHVFTGACGGPYTQIGCANNGGNGANETVVLTTVIGTNYLIRIQRAASNNAMDGSICIHAPLANNDPCGAVPLTVNVSCTNTASTNAGASATTGVPAPTCANYTGSDVWFSFVAPASGIANIETTAGVLTDTGIELYSATACNGVFTSIECDDDDGPGTMSVINRTGLTGGQTYYVRVWGYNGAVGSFSICVWYAPPPANDEPCASISLTLNTTCVSTTYTNVSASLTAGILDPGCGGYSGSSRDVWFSIVAPSTGSVYLEVTAGTMTNAAMALYYATACNGTWTLIECDDNDGPANTPFLYAYDLVPGSTYYLRVWGNGGTSGTFGLCAVTPATTADCFYALLMNDTGGDGWGGSTVGVSINAGPYTNYTLVTGNRSVAYIPMTLGDIIVLNYTAAGGFQNEISYILQSGYGILFSDGPTPTAGVVFGYANDCVAPDPPREDCYGGVTVCGASTINSNPSNTGLKSDLNLHSRGCLSNDERQGTWFNFSPSAPGTVAFTVVPSDPNDDYDFAVWGPGTSLSCPPTTTPYRCSYSGGLGNTGLLVGAGDDTEGAGGDKFVNAMNVAVGEIYILYVSNWSQSGLSFDLTWSLTAGASLDCTVLPIELLSFRADALNTMVALDWATASESGNSHFVVERSTDGEHFTAIGQVPGAGDSFTTIEYAFSDPQPTRGVNYYRLKQVDVDGTYTYSLVEAVSFGLSITAGTPFPNPADNAVNVNVEVMIDGNLELRLHDASGRLVHTSKHSVEAGEQLLSAPVQGLDPGSYLLSVIADDGSDVKAGRFIVQ